MQRASNLTVGLLVLVTSILSCTSSGSIVMVDKDYMTAKSEFIGGNRKDYFKLIEKTVCWLSPRLVVLLWSH